jgi:hypothetical protein
MAQTTDNDKESMKRKEQASEQDNHRAERHPKNPQFDPILETTVVVGAGENMLAGISPRNTQQVCGSEGIPARSAIALNVG